MGSDIPIFTRFTETIDKKKKKRIVSITIKPCVTDCEGSVWFTDLMLQEGDRLSGYVINTETLLKNHAPGDELNLLASSRQCLRNETTTSKDGFFQYSAAGDSKNSVTVEDKKSARLYVEFQETEDADIS